MSVICFRHPFYDGSERPALSCAACCGLFIGRIKQEIAAGTADRIDTSKWLEGKRRDHAAAHANPEDARHQNSRGVAEPRRVNLVP